jgi:transglutaminase-like putative cysteine protease
MSDKQATLQLIGVATLILSALFTIFSLPFFWQQLQVLRTWPVTDAQVLRSDVVAQPTSAHDQFYAAKLQILYTVDRKPVTAELTSFESRDYQATRIRAMDYSVGSHQRVRYDPQNPSQARIGAEWNLRFFAVPLIVLAMGIFFGALALALFSFGGAVKVT